jgi:hypothetical protein
VVLQVIVADTFTNLSVQHLGPDALPSQRSFVLLVTGVLVLLMCFPRNLQALGEQQQQGIEPAQHSRQMPSVNSTRSQLVLSTFYAGGFFCRWLPAPMQLDLCLHPCSLKLGIDQRA